MSKDLEDSWEGVFPTDLEIKPSTDLNISSNDTTGGDKLKIGVCSWNIGNNMKKIESLIDSLPSTDSDILIIGLQELPVTLIEGTNKNISDKKLSGSLDLSDSDWTCTFQLIGSVICSIIILYVIYYMSSKADEGPVG